MHGDARGANDRPPDVDHPDAVDLSVFEPARGAYRVPRSLTFAAAVSWRLLVVGAAAYVTLAVLVRLQVILVGTAIGILLACALWPAARRLRVAGATPTIAALAVVLASVAILATVGVVLASRAVDEIGELDVNVTGGFEVVETWLISGPLGLPEAEVQRFFDRTETRLRGAGDWVLRGAWGGALVAVEIAAGLILAFVLAFLFLKDGDRMWRWVCGFIPAPRQAEWDQIALDVRDVLAGFVRGTSIVAAVDAVGIGLGLYLLGVPLVLPIAALTFLGGFIPLVGATVAGLVAVMVALVSNGFWTALAVLGVVLLVQQVEGNVVQPFVVGRSVKLHPAVVLLAVGAGAILWGIGGALLAVPATAALATVVERMRRKPQIDLPESASVLETP